MRLDDAADLLCHACDPEEALQAGFAVLSNLMAQFRLNCGSRPMEWWLATLEQSKVQTLSRHESESILFLCAADAGGVSFRLPDDIRATSETRRLVTGMLQIATLIAVALQQIGHSREDIILDCQRHPAM
jgi:hypothetical protein